MTRVQATVRDIAQVAGVSAASVSRALRDPNKVSDRIRGRVRDALERLEAERSDLPERNGRQPSTIPTIGCLFVDSTSGPRFGGFDATIWAGLARAAISHGAEVLLLNADRRRPQETIADLVAARGIGALAVRLDEASSHLLDEIADARVPTIIVAHKHDHPELGYVSVASRETSRDAVRHLLHLGHRRIGFCRNIVPDQDHADRFDGYRDALAEFGIEPDPALEITAPADAEGGVTAINRLLALPDAPTAAYFADPDPTLGALRRLHELGLSIPADFSVVGFDDDVVRHGGCPVYTAVCQDAPALATLAGQVLCRMMLGGATNRVPRIELDSFLEVNGTTARPRKQ